MMQRDARGRFVTGNTIASLGGKARMSQLSKRQRRELAAYGFRMLAVKRFGGNKRKCAAWLFDPCRVS